MYRKYVFAAWRNLANNKLYAAINIGGLAISFAAAILIGLYVRDELTYDRWLPLHARTYLVGASVETSVRAPRNVDFSPAYFAAPLKLDFPQIEAVARLAPAGFSVRHGNVEALEKAYWADPDIFDLLRFAVLAGDLGSALRRPDGIVITRKIARKYFGRDTPLGEKLEIDRQHVMTVTAVIADMPSNANLKVGMIASGLAAFSAIRRLDANPARDFTISCLTYVRLRTGASIAALRDALPAFVVRHGWHLDEPGYHPRPLLIPLAALHLAPGEQAIISPRGDLSATLALAAAALVIVIIAAFNFINLATARAARRAAEIGIRKTMGASRRDIAVQFVCESLICAGLAAMMALAAIEWLLPPLRAALNADLGFSYLADPMLAAMLVLFVLLVSLASAFYPALLLSALRPSRILHSAGVARLRRALVVLQFAALTALLIAVGVIASQNRFALNGAAHIDEDQVFLINAGCRGAFRDAVAKVPGVRAVTCSSGLAMDLGRQGVSLEMAGAAALPAVLRPVGPGFFDFYGLHPVAGRFFDGAHPGDAVPADAKAPLTATVIVNEAALRKLNLPMTSAIGHAIAIAGTGRPKGHSSIIGVVKDVTLDAVHVEAPPAIYLLDPAQDGLVHVRLSGRDNSDALGAIARLWRDTGGDGPMSWTELRVYVRQFYGDILRQAVLFAAFAGIAVFIAGLGLFGLAASTAEHRIMEVGVRKAMGAGSRHVVALFTWEFAQPVLLANLLAWPLAFLAMRHWLAGFAYHIALPLWMFGAASALALTIALAAVSSHALLTARGKAADALRYE